MTDIGLSTTFSLCRRRPALPALAAASALVTLGCGGSSSSAGGPGGGVGIGEVIGSQDPGVEVEFDPDALPIPIVPLPNDVLTRPDPTSPTGRRVNVPLDSDTTFEFDIRTNINKLDGFGTFQNVSVAFDGPIDLDTVAVNFDDDPSNDTLYVINIDPDSERFGERVTFDANRDLLPLDVNGQRPQIFAHSPALPASISDLNRWDDTVGLAFHKGITLQNLIYPADNRFPFYEDATNTIVLQPTVPMEPAAVYGVYMTRGIRDVGGFVPRSPFDPAIALFTQFEDLNQGLPLLQERYGVAPGDLAFAWSFTTMDLFRAMDHARDGLDGTGPLAYLQNGFPPEFGFFDPATEADSILLPPNQIQLIAGLIGPVLAGGLDFESGGPFFDVIFQEFSLTDVAYVVGGGYNTPYFIGRTELFEPPFIEGTQRLDPANPQDIDEVQLFISVPRTVPPGTRASGFDKPPFPVLNFIHANQTDRIIGLAIAQEAASQGIAVASFNQPGHGPLFPDPVNQLDRLIATAGGDSEATAILDFLPEILALVNVLGFSDFPVDEPSPPEISFGEFIAEVLSRADLLRDLSDQEIREVLFEVPIVKFIFGRGRAELDIDNDLLVENGEGFFTADMAKTRDTIRQTMVDLMQLNRIILNLCVDHDGDGVLGPLEGDFNEDGVCDIGGPDHEIYMGGISQGGLLGGVFMGIESVATKAFLNVPGGANIPLVQRSTLEFVVERLFRQFVGPIAVAVPYDPAADPQDLADLGLGPGQIAVTFIDTDVDADIASLAAVNRALPEDVDILQRVEIFDAPEPTDLDAVEEPGFVHPVVVENLNRDLREVGLVGPGGAFSVPVPTDVGDRIRITFPTGQTEFVSVGEGLGLPRNTERFRRFNDVAQLVIDPADAVNYATRWFLHPPEGVARKQVLVQSDPGDTTVPVGAQVALARAAGLITDELDRTFMDAGLIFGEKEFPTDEEIPGLSSTLVDPCRCPDPISREPGCGDVDFGDGRLDFNDIIGTGLDYRDALGERLLEQLGEPNHSIFTWHLSGRHEYLLGPDTSQPRPALRYTSGAQRQGLAFVMDPTSFDPRIDVWNPECPQDILNFSSPEAIAASLEAIDEIFTPICGGCPVQITCGDGGCRTVPTYWMDPVSGTANTLVWLAPVLFIPVYRRTLRRRARRNRDRA